MACKKQHKDLMHKYLDGELTKEEEQHLSSHLQSCQECQKHFHELKRTVTLIKSTSELKEPSNFTEQVMANLPREKKRVGYIRWLKAHPIVTAAAIFFLFMFGGIFSAWEQDSELSVSKDQNLIIEDDTVIVPEGVTVDGDLVVKNGDLKIEGFINGDVTIINGEHLLASAGDISGEINQVNQIFGWIWYHLKDLVKSVFAFANA